MQTFPVASDYQWLLLKPLSEGLDLASRITQSQTPTPVCLTIASAHRTRYDFTHKQTPDLEITQKCGKTLN